MLFYLHLTLKLPLTACMSKVLWFSWIGNLKPYLQFSTTFQIDALVFVLNLSMLYESPLLQHAIGSACAFVWQSVCFLEPTLSDNYLNLILCYNHLRVWLHFVNSCLLNSFEFPIKRENMAVGLKTKQKYFVAYV